MHILSFQKIQRYVYLYLMVLIQWFVVILQNIRFDTMAIMINYIIEIRKEVEFVTWWCHQLQIPLYVRSITEVKRERNEKRIYEKITKKYVLQCIRNF